MGISDDARVIEIVSGNLFDIAAKYLGNAMQWVNIARANNLIDPVIKKPMRIKLPNYSAIFSDGLGPR
jgi:nucleoid-associated protein YgaU